MQRGVDQRAGGAVVTKVERQAGHIRAEHPQLGNGRVDLGGKMAVDDEAHAFARQPQRDALTNAATGARDDGDLTAKFRVTRLNIEVLLAGVHKSAFTLSRDANPALRLADDSTVCAGQTQAANQ